MTDIHGPECHPHGIRGFGDPTYGVVFVGIAPGRNEVALGKPFVGASGALLNAILKAVGWPREQCYCTNLICWYKDDPTVEEIALCEPRLRRELETMRPKIVVPLGRLAAETLTQQPLSRVRGAPTWSPEGHYYILSTYHPAAILRGGLQFIHDIARDLQKIPLILGWPNDGSIAEVTYQIMHTPAGAQTVLDNLPHDIPVSVDIETSSTDVDTMDVFNDRLLCLSLSTGTQTWVFTETALSRSLKWPIDEVQWTFHNGMFDVQGLMRYLNVALPIVEDTLLQSYSLDERGGIHSLGQLAGEYCGAGHYKEEGNLKKLRKHGQLHLAPQDVVWRYNARDGAYTARLTHTLKPMQDADNVTNLYRTILIPAANALAQINYRGVHVDMRQVRKLALEWAPRYLKEEQALIDSARALGFAGEINLNSPLQLSHLLFGILGLQGGPSTRQSVLETLENEHPYVKRLMAFRHLDHMLGNYILGIEDDLKRDGRLHPDTLLHGTRTGRTAYKRPPLQTIPKEYTLGEDFGRIRRIFGATNDDYVIVEADYKTAEVWAAYAHSFDPQMYDDLTSGDYHGQVTRDVYKITPADVTKEEWDLKRYKTKFVTFGIMYGRGAPSLAKGELECSVREAELYIERWFGRYPVYRAWWERTRQRAAEEGELVSVTGRKRRFKLVLGEDSYKALNQAVNFPIQSAVSDCKLASVVKLHSILSKYDSYILFEVHDSIIFEVAKRHLDTVLALIRTVMPGPHFEGMPAIGVDLKVGPSWGLAKAIK